MGINAREKSKLITRPEHMKSITVDDIEKVSSKAGGINKEDRVTRAKAEKGDDMGIGRTKLRAHVEFALRVIENLSEPISA